MYITVAVVISAALNLTLPAPGSVEVMALKNV
jgi:hypothetical protein